MVKDKLKALSKSKMRSENMEGVALIFFHISFFICPVDLHILLKRALS
jgi:hypothetical protein